ncbi:MAG: hypothetical protein V5A43_09870 [Haloarculaceae archaeon]
MSLVPWLLLALLTTRAVGPALAHGGGIGAAGRSTLRLPTWLVLLTGGTAVGASFLLSSFVTDRTLIRAIDGWRRRLPWPGRPATLTGRLLGLLVLATVLVVGFVGPSTSANLAVFLVWVGWWAGFTMLSYLVGNAWPALNPWRTIAGILPSIDRSYPRGIGSWPALVGLLALVWLEVVTPLASKPAQLAAVVLGYTAMTLAGAVLIGPAAWFRFVDPVANVFRNYGRVAPIGRADEGGLELRLPATALTRSGSLTAPGDVAFVVALLWATTFDGLVATPAWGDALGGLASVGVPPVLVYPLALLAGFGIFLAAFHLAARLSRRVATTYLARATLLELVAPSLLAIAAGYHLAHYLGYFLTYAPAAVAVAAAPFAARTAVPTLALPAWFEFVGMAAVLLGHLLAIWVAHARAFAAIPDRMDAIRSQAPFVAVMVGYTMTSLWIVAQPEVPVPYT